jgi:hypothetical protein
MRLFQRRYIPNGGSRNKIEAKNMKLEGVTAGIPDLMIPLPNKRFAGLFIEMKRVNRRNKPSDKQKEWIERLNNVGYKAVVCYGFEEAKKVIDDYVGEM